MSLRAAVFAMYVGVVIILVLIGVKFESGIAIVVVEATAFPLMFLLWLHLLYTKVYFVEPVDRDGANPPSDDAAPP